MLSLKKEFAKSFSNSDLVILCPLYAAGEKKNYKYNQVEFAKLISKYSKTQVINIKDYFQINKFFEKNLINNEIVIGMGAGVISKYMRNLREIL